MVVVPGFLRASALKGNPEIVHLTLRYTLNLLFMITERSLLLITHNAFVYFLTGGFIA